MIVIMGASGNTGSKITQNLLDNRQTVRVIGRSRERLQGFVDRGAEAFVGDALDSDFLTDSFTDARAIFAMIPRDNSVKDLRAQDNRFGESIAQAIRNSGLKYVVNLSSLSAYRSDKNGPVKGLYDQEQRLNKLDDVDILHLRPAYFMDNFLRYMGMVKRNGIIATPFKPDLQFPMVSTKDIADAATQFMLKRNFSGKIVRELRGERDLSFEEATKIIAERIKNPDLKYVQLSYEEAQKGAISAGVSLNVSTQMVELVKSMNDGFIGQHSPRTSENTTPTSFEEFAEEFAKIYAKYK
ncbi:MAG: NmrA family NAD(P)-binding protein, partial [Deltaproteobacteria bacterium]|nr:NmrA family NAD(P)-binding protein [Deltaproteobacteria bacterium]